MPSDWDEADYDAYAHGEYLEEQEFLRGLQQAVQHARGLHINNIISAEREIDELLMSYLSLPDDRKIFFRYQILKHLTLARKIDGLKELIAHEHADEFKSLIAELREANKYRNRLAHDIVLLAENTHTDTVQFVAMQEGEPVTKEVTLEQLQAEVDDHAMKLRRLSELRILLIEGPQALNEQRVRASRVRVDKVPF